MDTKSPQQAARPPRALRALMHPVLALAVQ